MHPEQDLEAQYGCKTYTLGMHHLIISDDLIEEPYSEPLLPEQMLEHVLTLFDHIASGKAIEIFASKYKV